MLRPKHLAIALITLILAPYSHSSELTVCHDAWTERKHDGFANVDIDYIFHYKATVRKGSSCKGPKVAVDEIILYDMRNANVHLGTRSKDCFKKHTCWHQHYEDNIRDGNRICYSIRASNKGKLFYNKTNVCRFATPIK